MSLKFTSAVIFVFLSIQIGWAAEPEYAHHPEIKEPLFLNIDIYENLKNKLPPPPAEKSSAQIKDEKELFHFQKIRTDVDCEQARSEVPINLKTFFGGPKGSLSDGDIDKLTPFFAQLRNDSDFFIHKIKKEYPRQRPYDYIAGLNPCIAREKSLAYPSGHTALARVFSKVLGDLYPKEKAKLKKRADEIAKDRVLAGVHHPTDIDTGKALGDLLYQELKKSKAYESAYKEAAMKIDIK